MNILKQKDIEANPDNLIEYLRPFRIIISLLDKPEIGKDTHMVEILNCKVLYFGLIWHDSHSLTHRAIGVVWCAVGGGQSFLLLL